MIFPNLLLNTPTLALTTVRLGLTLSSGLKRAPKKTSALVSINLAVFPMILVASSSGMWHFNVASSDACLVNAFSPPHFSTYHISDSYSYGFSPVRIETFIHKLVQSLYVRFRKV